MELSKYPGCMINVRLDRASSAATITIRSDYSGSTGPGDGDNLLIPSGLPRETFKG